MIEQISVEDAFRAMVIFLDRYYDRGGGVDTLGDVLSAISQTMWADRSPNDPAQWQDWLDAVKEATK
jgi:hypothetical protein